MSIGLHFGPVRRAASVSPPRQGYRGVNHRANTAQRMRQALATHRVSAAHLARVSATRLADVSAMLSGLRPISIRVARALHLYTGIPERVWLRRM